MTFKDINEIKKAGFTGFITIEDLQYKNSAPDEKGIYFILNLNTNKGRFLTVGTGGYFKGKNPNVTTQQLFDNWVDDTACVYIGKATSLKKRLQQYLSFGQGKDIGHYGGRFIWQLKQSKNLIVCWKLLHEETPRKIEKQLLQLFVLQYKKRPFANLRD